jgi:hypothetical protein
LRRSVTISKGLRRPTGNRKVAVSILNKVIEFLQFAELSCFVVMGFIQPHRGMSTSRFPLKLNVAEA